jgi:hypothetical protein
MALQLISGSQKNTSSPSGYITLPQTQAQLGQTPSSSTGFTLVADKLSIVSYVSSLGNLNFDKGVVTSNLPNQNITFVGNGTGTVVISGPQLNTGTNTGVLVVQGGIGIAEGLHTGKDIHVNGLTIGQGYNGANNIVIIGSAAEITNSDEFDGENNISIGYDSFVGMPSSQGSIAIGRYALSTGTQIANSIAIGDSSLKNLGTKNSMFVGTVTNITTGSTTTVTVINHGLSTGSVVTLKGITGSLGSEINEIPYIIRVLSANTFALFATRSPQNDYQFAINSQFTLVAENISIDSSEFGTGNFTSATVYRSIFAYSNIALGDRAGQSFYNGQQNFFLGNAAAENFTTGSFNFFIGYNVVSNMKSGDRNFSIGNSNFMRDGRSNQIAFGNSYYYNGLGLTTLNTDVFIQGSELEDIDATGAFNSTGALRVYGGAGIKRSLYVGEKLNVTGTGTVTLAPTSVGTVVINPVVTTGTIDNMIIGATVERPATFSIGKITTSTNSTGTNSGALTVVGGVGINKDLYIGLQINSNTANFRATTASTSTTTGAVTVAGGVGVQGSVYSNDGNSYENNLLYSPKVTVSATLPAYPKVGDFWINTNNLVEYQYIIDDGNKFWIQIAQL